ncbi:hypothetical protein RQP46_006728 [Phenoliferia psychrophenolica]
MASFSPLPTGPNEYPQIFSFSAENSPTSPHHRWERVASPEPSSSSSHRDPSTTDQYGSQEFKMEEPRSPYFKESDAFVQAPPHELLRGGSVDRDDHPTPPRSLRTKERAVPIPFRRPFAIFLISLMVLLAVGVEVIRAVSVHTHGFVNPLLNSENWNKAHYLYTTIIVAISLPVTALWGWYTFWVKASQPYLSLSQGGEPADTTLLLDYTSESDFFILWPAIKRKHHLTVLAILLSLLTLLISPFASALFAVKNISVPSGNVTTTQQSTLGLSNDYATFDPALKASGFALGRVAYNLDWPPFIDANGAVGRWNMSSGWGKNGTVFSDTVAIKMAPNCVYAQSTVTSSTSVTNGTTYGVTLRSSSCASASFSHTVIDTAGTDVFIGALSQCSSTETDPEFLPVAFVAFRNGAPTASICTPTMQVLPAPLDATYNTLLQAPINGRALNGIALNSSITATDLLESRLTTTLTNLGAAVALKAGTTTSDDGFNNAVTFVFLCYLNVLASSALYRPDITAGVGQVIRTQNRLIITAIAAHILCVVFSILAFAGGWLMHAHAKARHSASFVMPETPGLAGVVSVAGELTHLLEEKEHSQDLKVLLKDHRYALDRDKRSIVVIEGGPNADKVRKRLSRMSGIPPGTLPSTLTV